MMDKLFFSKRKIFTCILLIDIFSLNISTKLLQQHFEFILGNLSSIFLLTSTINIVPSPSLPAEPPHHDLFSKLCSFSNCWSVSLTHFSAPANSNSSHFTNPYFIWLPASRPNKYPHSPSPLLSYQYSPNTSPHLLWTINPPRPLPRAILASLSAPRTYPSFL